jgi:hypothetical protein
VFSTKSLLPALHPALAKGTHLKSFNLEASRNRGAELMLVFRKLREHL